MDLIRLSCCNRNEIWRLLYSLLHNLLLALVEHLGQDSKHRIVVKIQLQTVARLAQLKSFAFFNAAQVQDVAITRSPQSTW